MFAYDFPMQFYNGNQFIKNISSVICRKQKCDHKRLQTRSLKRFARVVTPACKEDKAAIRNNLARRLN